VATQDDAWLEAARDCGRFVIRSQERDGLLRHLDPMKHTFVLQPGWASAMAQGQAASLFVRLFAETNEPEFAQAAVSAVESLATEVPEGGLMRPLGGGLFPEEYPTTPASFVLNGALFALWGLRDVGVGLSDGTHINRFNEASSALACNLHRWDVGFWSLYSLYSVHPIRNIASHFYHHLHVSQLRATSVLAEDNRFDQYAERFARYAISRTGTARAIAEKSAFRVLVPRRPNLAFKYPWFRNAS
jgi:hypothetical protein